MNIGTQMVAMMVVLVVAMEFLQYSRLRLLSTKMFEVFLYISIACIISEIVCVYAIAHPQYFSIAINRGIHQFFIGTLDFLIWYIYLYVDLRGRPSKSYNIIQFSWRTIPFVAAIGYVLFGSINFHFGPDGIYSYGSIVNTVYYMCGVYISLITYTILRYKESYRKLAKYDFWISLVIWASIAVYQWFYPTAMLSSIALSLMVLFIYIVFENSKENADKEIPSVFSRHSFETTVKELFGEKKRFWLINFSLQNIDSMRATYGQRACIVCIDKSIGTIPEFKQYNMFRTMEYGFGFMVFSEEDLKKWYAQYKVSDKTLNVVDSNIQPSFFVCAIECPTIAKNPEDLFNLMNFCKNEFDAQSDYSIRIIDKITADKRQYILAVEALVQRAIDEDGFYVVYQPIINSKTGHVDSAEALVRLKDNTTYGFISPEVFIPVAESKGLISQLGEMVFSKVCQFASENLLEKRGLKYLEVNLSAIQMTDTNLPFRLHQCVKNYGLDPKFINFEVTETAAVRSGKVATENMEKLRKLGYHFSMDDFGTGYSNFSQITNLKYDLIKIDKSLIWPAFGSGNLQARTILLALVNMLHSLGFSIVAEGIETDEQAEILADHGVEYFQGYLYSKPIEPGLFLEFLDKYNKDLIDLIPNDLEE